MLKSKTLAALSLVAILAVPVQGFSQTQPDPHHSDQDAATTEQATGSQSQQDMMKMMSGVMNMMGGMMNMMGSRGGGQIGMGGQQPGMGGGQPQQDMMMNMMSGMMKMMGGGQMGRGGMDMQPMGMNQHVEGRIAFLRAELNITKAQEKAWNDFVAALHGAAERLKDAGAPAMPGMANADIPAQLDVQEKMLSSRLEGIRGIKAALVPLYAVLTEDQRKLANNLLVGPMGFMGPGMMPGRMAQGGMMQGGMGNMMQGGMMSNQGNGQ